MLSRLFPALLLLAGTASLASAQVDYVRDVKPILAKHCYRCHGASQQKGGLRADTVAFLKEGGDTGTSLAPGDARASILVQVLLGTHEDISQMPYKKPALADADIAAIRSWIDAGAAAPDNEVPDKAVFGYPWVPGVFVVAMTGLLLNAIYERPVQSLLGVGLVALGVPIFRWRRAVGDSRPSDVTR